MLLLTCLCHQLCLCNLLCLLNCRHQFVRNLLFELFEFEYVLCLLQHFDCFGIFIVLLGTFL